MGIRGYSWPPRSCAGGATQAHGATGVSKCRGQAAAFGSVQAVSPIGVAPLGDQPGGAHAPGFSACVAATMNKYVSPQQLFDCATHVSLLTLTLQALRTRIRICTRRLGTCP